MGVFSYEIAAVGGYLVECAAVSRRDALGEGTNRTRSSLSNWQACGGESLNMTGRICHP